MKKMKKIFALLIAMVMVLGMSTSVFAASIAINSGAAAGDEDKTSYTYYEIFKADIGTAASEGEEAPVSYYIPAANKELADAVAETGLFTVTLSGDKSRYNVVLTNESTSGADIAAALDVAAITGKALATGTFAQDGKNSTNGGKAVVEGLDPGFYVIESSLGSVLAAQTLDDVTINEKNTYPGLTKTEDVENAEIGGTVTYTITVEIPANVKEKDIVVFDNMSDGLTMNTAITVSDAEGLTTLTWATDSDYSVEGRNGYKTTIAAADVIANKGKTITLTYTATVNEKAVVDEPEDNTSHLEYDNYKSVEVEKVEVKTFGFDLTKIGDNDEDNPLAGVKFTLTNEDGKYYDQTENSNPRFVTDKKEVVTANDGTIAFAGLAEGTYILTETETVSGYNLLAGPITIVIDENGDATFTGEGITFEGNAIVINNESGSVLPSTGGIGTTIFYIIGAILVVGAGVVLVTRRRMNVQ